MTRYAKQEIAYYFSRNASDLHVSLDLVQSRKQKKSVEKLISLFCIGHLRFIEK